MQKIFSIIVLLLIFVPCWAESATMTNKTLDLLAVSADMHDGFLKNQNTQTWKCGQINGDREVVYKVNYNVIIAYDDKSHTWYHIITSTQLPVTAFALYVDDTRVVRANTVVLDACKNKASKKVQSSKPVQSE